MYSVGRKVLEMITRVVDFLLARPDTDAGQQVSTTRLKEVQELMQQMDALQRTGLIEVRTSADEKRRLRREMLAGPIVHLAEVGRLAAREHPEVVHKLRYAPSKHNYQAHRTAARSMQAEAEANKEVLAKYGLSDAVLDVFGELLDQFDAAVKLGADGRVKHTTATKQIRALAVEAGQLVRAMDARNRHRFKNDGQALGEWIAVSTMVGRAAVPETSGPVSGPAGEEGKTPDAGGDVRPAA
jgi:hypothetical protein